MSKERSETPHDPVFADLSADGRIARSARMMDADTRLQENQRVDILERFRKFIDDRGMSRGDIARELGFKLQTVNDLLNRKLIGPAADAHLVAAHNYMELSAKRGNLLRKKAYVEHSVAREILQVAGIVAETCKIGVVYGPARIGKSITLDAIVGDARFGSPVLIRINESLVRPFPLCRAIARHFDLRVKKAKFDDVFHRIVNRLAGTMRMLIFDEVERVNYSALEMIRDLHDQTGCPVLLCGKPLIYERLGCRQVGDFSEVTDQLAARIVIRRDLTERTRGKNPQPLFTKDDIRKIIDASSLQLKVSPDAIKWLQIRACTLGSGGLGRAMVCLYLAVRVAFARGAETLTSEHLDGVEHLTMGHDDADRLADAVTESTKIRRLA